MAVTHLGFSLPGSSPEIPAGAGQRFVAVPRDLSYKPLELIKGFVGSTPFSVMNYMRSDMASALEELLRKEPFDIVQLESIHLAGYLPIIRAGMNGSGVIVCDWHNIESEVLQRYGENTRSFARRAYARHVGRKLADFERRFVQECDMHVVVSERDRDALFRYGSKAPVVVIENGVDTEQFATPAAGGGAAAAPKRILFVGAMDYHANIDGAVFFAKEVWPQVAAKLPDAIFTIVGRSPAPRVLELARQTRIEVTGTVADVRPYYREALVAVAPLRVGGGTRLKILEAMAAGIPVVSTTLGAEGLVAENRRHYIVADSAQAMTAAILALVNDPALSQRIAAAGRQLVQQRYDWAILGDALADQLLTLVRG